MQFPQFAPQLPLMQPAPRPEQVPVVLDDLRDDLTFDLAHLSPSVGHLIKVRESRMSFVKNSSGGPLDVPLLNRTVEADEVVEVPDFQPGHTDEDPLPIIWPPNRWEPVEAEADSSDSSDSSDTEGAAE